MRLIVCENYDELSKKVAKIIASQITLKPECVLGLPTGSTPKGMYKRLVKMNQRGDIDFSCVKTFNLDEYYPISRDNPQSCNYYMHEHLFSKININKNNTHILSGTAEDAEAECKSYETLIEKSGGIDLQILSIGHRGHLGFNEPEANLNAFTHMAPLSKKTISSKSHLYDKEEDIPKHALTMGISSILRSKKIILLAGGADKHRVVMELMHGGINTAVPATMLKVHPDVTLICDKAAYEGMKIGVDIGGTEIKFGVVNDSGELLHTEIIETRKNVKADDITSDIAHVCKNLAEEYPISGVGIGTPGLITAGRVNAANLPFKDYPLAAQLEKKLNIPVQLSNDANCAALGESIAGSGKDVSDMILVTLGTGIGGGIILGGKIYEGKGSAGEIGHMCLIKDGKSCGCGKNGCWEKYAAASVLCELAEDAAKENTDSILYDAYIRNNNRINGKKFFESYNQGCPVATKVFDLYIDYLCQGLESLISIFDPDMIVLSGGISAVGDTLIKPIKEKLSTDIPIKTSILANNAGIIGAASL